MRKFMLTTALVLPLSMGAAFAQDATTPATDSPAATTEAPADPAAAPEAGSTMDAAPEGATDDPAAAEVDAAAEEAAAAAAAAEVAASGKVVQEQAATELRLDWVTGASVVTADATPIGNINDIIVDSETGQMIAAVIGVGGFLGIGQKQIAVPWDQLVINYDAQEITSDLTKEEAEAAPEYVFRQQEAAPGAVPADATAPVDPAAPADPAAAPADPAAMPTDPAAAPADPAAMPTDPAAVPAEGETAPAN
ncbi:PRC-barrel domain-containing protein [Paracoccus sp. 11-3]|uniref:PRC-barrel domain-containing protein n=1 Tax=Paracoccus amoyensis TaxID=2760093 RepID=A0A926GBW0_9RHOB|nr:PRC-barrel domain-containing protein [Paracoccus amoyensis]MBC9245477.1 PRC-barrel domain-containing protein [Paracoccus amoyensis]